MDARPKHSADGCHMCMLLTPAKETCPKMASLPALMVLVAKKGSFCYRSSVSITCTCRDSHAHLLALYIMPGQNAMQKATC